MSAATERLSEEQRAALWKWRWLGWRRSNPAFKASMLLAATVALIILAVSMN